MDIKMTLNELTTMLDRLNVNYIVDEVNKYILHLKIIKNNDIFRLRFEDRGFGFEFTYFLEG